MSAAAKPGWVILAYYGLQFLVGLFVHITYSDHTGGLLDLGSGALLWLLMANFTFIWVPWDHQTWFAVVAVILAPVGIALAWWRLRGWTRLLAIIALLVALNASNLYLVALAGA